MVHGGAAPPGGQEEAAASGEDACGDKRAQPEQREAEDEAPATRPCLQLENGARGGAESMACRVARQRARRLLPARHRENCVSTPLRSATHASTVLRGVEEMYRENTLCDVTMRVDDENFPAHRIVLAAASDFLRALLTGSWRESKEDVVRLDGIDRHSFRLMLEYIYTGEVQPGGLEELFNLVATSDHVGLFDLRDLCVHRLQQQLDISNSLLMRVCAAEIGCTEVETCASDYVLGDFAQVVEISPEFLLLGASEVSDIISSDRLAVDSEEEVLTAVLKWASHDPEERREALPGILAHVRMGLLPLDSVERLVPLWPLLGRVLIDVPQCVAQVENGKRLQKLVQLQQAPPDEVQVRARAKRVKRALLALGGRPAWTKVEKFEVKANRWTQVAPMLHQRMRHGSASMAGLIYVVGGKDESGRALQSLERYDPRKDQWEELQPMKVARTGLGVSSLQGLLYAVGGRNDAGSRLKSTECYNAQTQQWTDCPDMNEARGAVRVAALNHRIYAVGGRSETHAALSSVEVFDPVSNAWTFVKPMHTARVGAGVEVLEGRLYAVGGKDESGNKLKSVERYDPGKNEWELVANMGTKRWGAGVAVMEKRLWVIGGMNGAERGSKPTLEVYDPVSNKWEEINPGPTLARGSCTFAAA
eukprot:Tamp_06361.p1 GENE.Tamp_06361~~Tamp_06361.p1  ORF type:complete len:649 (-),score=133.36 Tamp_06361:706-2652(-)